MAIAAFLTLSGCTQQVVDLRGDNFRDDYAFWGETNRPAGLQGEHFGTFSTKARQIERNLGVR